MAFEAYETLAREYEVIIIEGAGSPAEINLRKDDFVNMGLAEYLRSPVLLIGDIDRGGVFAQLYGTLMLLSEDERSLVKGLIINKFRGNLDLLRDGLTLFEKRGGKPFLGVVPLLEVDIEDEDSLSGRFTQTKKDAVLDIGVIRLPKIANFTDFYVLEAIAGLRLRYIDSVQDMHNLDMLIIPGTKNTIADLAWLRARGMDRAIIELAAGIPILGICGGYQILGAEIIDGDGVERAGGGSVAGLGLLDMVTVFTKEKQRSLVKGTVSVFGSSEVYVEGYEIHMGQRYDSYGTREMPSVVRQGNVYGTYLHGLFDTPECRKALIAMLCGNKGIPNLESHGVAISRYREEQFDRLAAELRRHLNIDRVYRILEEGL
jgi:adenosylcobyric acid synthase